MPRPRILCISLSPISRDARVLRQLDVLSEHGDVTTVGYGPRPTGATDHVVVPDSALTLPQTPMGVLKLATRRLRSAELDAPAVRYALQALEGQRFDLVVANDARSLALAFRLAEGAPVWGDMHEWAPGQRDQYVVWRLMVAPLMDYMCRTYLPQCAAVSTVAESLVHEYDRVYGTQAELVRNSRPWEDLEPTPLSADGRLRLVHSGGAEPNRNLSMLIDAAVELEHTTLDLYLVSAGDGGKYLRMLQEQAAVSDRITIHDPVPPAELPMTLNAYDVGVFSLPPDNFNMENCLPNKLFDFLQARLAFAVSPSPEMARFVRENELGVVSADYSQDAFVRALRTLTPEGVVAAKESAHRHAKELSSDTDVAASHAIVRRLLGD
ncbi:glycosyltransferase [Knoellia sp. p5-6-4]|uniref:glycosyltransferase n=1 Tax=unclassified Knoellia TaxID=2618719 RepID=UPI0023DBFF2B|nr:glycosyltransferase [Knoellia sp. p5-6-4]MDF2146482.1 glycosyltransferase [Knoellia sp. p5-6-4]